MHAYYQSGQKEQAIDTADTFMRENPTHPRVDYALYIKGLSYFERDAGRLERLFRRDITKRPPVDVELSYSTLRRLVERYPDSTYAPDAEQRMVAMKNRLAEYENHVADYYLRRGAYVAAVRRAKSALEEFKRRQRQCPFTGNYGRSLRQTRPDRPGFRCPSRPGAELPRSRLVGRLKLFDQRGNLYPEVIG